MRSFKQNREQISERAHLASDQLRDKKDDLKERATGQVQEVKASLHRRPLGGGGQWDKLSPGTKLNIHQRVAAKTRGYGTLANVLSVTGAGLTGYGLYQASQNNYGKAAGYMFMGRMLDLVDGKVAAKTGTCSDKGAAIDAGLDKMLAIVALPLLTRNRLLDPIEAAAHGAQQCAIFYESVLIKNHGGEPNPGEDGKYGTALLWARIGGSAVSESLYQRDNDGLAAFIGCASVVASIAALNSNGKAYSLYNQQRLAAVDDSPIAA